MRPSTILALAATLGFCASIVLSETHAMIDKSVEADLQVSEWVDHIMQGEFDANQRNLLKSVGHQMAVAGQCDGFAVDNEKTNAVMLEVIAGHTKEDAAFDDVQAVLMMSLGAFIAAGITSHALDPDGFCADAAAEREAEEADTDHLIWASAD